MLALTAGSLVMEAESSLAADPEPPLRPLPLLPRPSPPSHSTVRSTVDTAAETALAARGARPVRGGVPRACPRLLQRRLAKPGRYFFGLEAKDSFWRLRWLLSLRRRLHSEVRALFSDRLAWRILRG